MRRLQRREGARSAIAVAREPGDVNHADGDKINQAPRRQRGNRISRTRPKRRKRGRPCIMAATFGYRMRGILRANVAPPVNSDPELSALSLYQGEESIPRLKAAPSSDKLRRAAHQANHRRYRAPPILGAAETQNRYIVAPKTTIPYVRSPRRIINLAELRDY